MMRGLRRNWKELVIPLILLILAAWLWGSAFALFGFIMLLAGILVGAAWE